MGLHENKKPVFIFRPMPLSNYMSGHVEAGKIAALLAFLIALTAVVSSASVQHHPFSELFPPDIDLDFGAQNIDNVSDISTDTVSPVQSDIVFRDAGNAETLRWDNSAGEWKLNGVDFNLKGNNITSIDTLHFQQGMTINGSINTTGGSVDLDDGDINRVNSIDGGGDAVRFDDVINMNTNSIDGLNNLYFNSGSDTYVYQKSDGRNIIVQADDSGGNKNNYLKIDPDNDLTSIPTGDLDISNGGISIPFGQGLNATGYPNERVLDTGWDGSYDYTALYTPGNNNPNEVLYLRSDGRLGINTTGPGYTLDVDGPAEVNGNFYVRSGNIDTVGNDVTSSGGEICVGQYC